MKKSVQGSHSIEIKVKPSEIDPYNIVNHSNYLDWNLLAIQDWMALGGMKGYDKIFDFDQYTIVRTKCKYLSSAAINDIVLINTRIHSVDIEKGNLVIFKQESRNKKSGAILVTSEIHIQFTSVNK